MAASTVAALRAGLTPRRVGAASADRTETKTDRREGRIAPEHAQERMST